MRARTPPGVDPVGWASFTAEVRQLAWRARRESREAEALLADARIAKVVKLAREPLFTPEELAKLRKQRFQRQVDDACASCQHNAEQHMTEDMQEGSGRCTQPDCECSAFVPVEQPMPGLPQPWPWPTTAAGRFVVQPEKRRVLRRNIAMTAGGEVETLTEIPDGYQLVEEYQRRHSRPGRTRELIAAAAPKPTTPTTARSESYAALAQASIDAMREEGDRDRGALGKALDALRAFAAREQPPIRVEVAPAPAPIVHVAAQPAPVVNVQPPKVDVHVEQPRPRGVRVETDPQTGERRYVPIEADELEDD
jgi:hypothetical protein